MIYELRKARRSKGGWDKRDMEQQGGYGVGMKAWVGGGWRLGAFGFLEVLNQVDGLRQDG